MSTAVNRNKRRIMAVKKHHWALLLTLYGYMTLVECTNPIVLKLNSSTDGLLDVRYEGKWGGICTYGGRKPQFDDNAAKVACRQMGFRTGTKHTFGVDFFPLKLDMVLSNVTCKGNEIGISQCLIQPYTSATTGCGYAIKVDCTDDPALDGLLNATFSDKATKAHEGILQVTKDGTKGDVCFVNTTSADAAAKVVCKQMGYSGYHSPTSVNSSSSTSFYDVSCQGTEQTLAACTLSTPTTCSSGNVTNVQCKLDKATQRRFDIRLSSPNNSMSEGTVEVYQYGRWGVVCDTEWDKNDTEVVCRELGYKSAITSPTAANFGQGTGVVFWNKMRCNGNEPSIANCAKDVALGTKTCDSANAAGVVCNTEKLKTYDLCDNGNVTILKDETFFFAPDLSDYKSGTSCVCETVNTTTPAQFDVYVNAKIFQSNTEETLVLDAVGDIVTLRGEDSFAGPFKHNVTTSFKIKFVSNKGRGSGQLRIQVKASSKQTFSCIKTVPTTTTATTGTSPSNDEPVSGGIHDTTPHDNNTDMIIGIVVGAVILIILVIILIILWKKGFIKTNNRPRRDSSVGSYEKNIGGQEGGSDSKSDHNGGVINKAFATDTSMFAAKPQGSGVLPGNGDAKEPETGETERKTKLTRPASGSGIDVEIERASTGLNAYELEELPKGGVPTIHDPCPYELEGAPMNQASSRSEEPVTKGPPHFIVGGPGNQEYAMVNKPRMGTALPPLSPKGAVGNQEYAIVNKSAKGLPPLAPKFTVGDQEYAVVNKPKNDTGGVPLSGPTVPLKLSEAGPTVPPKNLDGPMSPDVPGDNLVKDQSTEPHVTGVPEYNPYQDVEEESIPPFNKPNTFMPVSAAYADVELGAPGEPSKIHDQPKQEEPTKAEKKKKHGKDKKKPEKENKKKWRKDKKKSKENLAEGAVHAPVGNDSCAVPMRDDFDKPPECEYAEVGARIGVGQINPAGQPELNNSETYDRLDFKGRKTGPQNPEGEATYDSVHRL